MSETKPETKVVPLNLQNPQFNHPNAQNHPVIVTMDNLYEYIETLMKECGVFSQEEIDFVRNCCSRMDGQPGVDQVAPLIQLCENFVNAKREGKISLWDKLKYQNSLRKALEMVMITAYRQKRILVGVSMRRKHPKYDIYNLNGMIASQKLRIDCVPVYGLGYVEARTYLIKKSLELSAYSGILLCDDDTLLPINVVEALSDYNLPVVAAAYVKKNPTLESIATTVVPNPNSAYGYENIMVKPEEGSMTPVQVGCFGLGCVLIATHVFKHVIPEEKDWLKFVHEALPDGRQGRTLIGEDAYLTQNLQAHGVRSFVVPGICGVHAEFRTGKLFGPSWLVDAEKNEIVPKYKDKYTAFPNDLDLKSLVFPDNDNAFQNSSF